MGLIKAAMGAAGGVMADQWKEFFYCDSMDKDVMVKKGQNVFQEDPPTQKAAITLLQTEVESLLQTVSV